MVTFMVICAVAPAARAPKLQVTAFCEVLQVPCVELAEVRVTPEGSVSLNDMPVAPPGPLLVTVARYPKDWAGVT
jgi:hypothetical protein